MCLSVVELKIDVPIRVGRTSGAEKFRSLARKDFFNSINPQRSKR
jgi:hypothetical protein